MIDESDCIFCFEEVDLKKKIIECEYCFHYYHNECWECYEKSYLKINNLNVSIKCPYCQQIIKYNYYQYIIKIILFFWFFIHTLYLMMNFIENIYYDDEDFLLII